METLLFAEGLRVDSGFNNSLEVWKPFTQETSQKIMQVSIIP